MEKTLGQVARDKAYEDMPPSDEHWESVAAAVLKAFLEAHPAIEAALAADVSDLDDEIEDAGNSGIGFSRLDGLKTLKAAAESALAAVRQARGK